MDIHRQVVLQGGSPIRRSEINDPTILKRQPYLKLYDRLIADSVYRARIPEWPELQDIISRELTRVMKSAKTAGAAAKAVDTWITARKLYPK